MCIYLNKLNLNIHDTQDPKVNFFELGCCSLQGANLEKPEFFSCSCFQSKYIQNFQEKCLLKKLPYKKSVGILCKGNWNRTLSRPGMEIEVWCSWNNMEYLKLITNGYSFSANMERVIKPAWIEKCSEHDQNPTAVFPSPALCLRCGLAVTKWVSLSTVADFWEVQSLLPGSQCIYVFTRDKL